MSATRSVPTHLLPENCYICGYPSDHHPAVPSQEGHEFWSNRDANLAFDREISNRGLYDVAVAYVDKYWGR